MAPIDRVGDSDDDGSTDQSTTAASTTDTDTDTDTTSVDTSDYRDRLRERDQEPATTDDTTDTGGGGTADTGGTGGGGGYVGVGQDEPTDPGDVEAGTGGDTTAGGTTDTDDTTTAGGGGGYVGVGQDEPTDPGDVETGTGGETAVGGPPGTVQRDDGTYGPERDTGAGESPAPGSGPGGYTRAPGTTAGGTEPTDPSDVDQDSIRSNFDSAAEYLEWRTESQFENVDDGEIYTWREENRTTPRFTGRGARQAIASYLGEGVTPSDVELNQSAGPGGYTVEDVAQEIREEQTALGRGASELGDVARQQLETGQEVAVFEDAQARREQATEGIAAQARSEGIDPDRLEAQTGRDIDQDGDITTPDEYVAGQVTERFDTLERGRDFTVDGQDGQVAYTDRGLTALETELETETGQRLTVERGDDGGLDVSQDTSEQFGDAPVTIPFTGGTRVEDVLEGGVNIGQQVGEGLGGAAAYASPLDDDAPVDNVLRGAGQGVGDLVSAVPAFALAAKEAGEATGYVAKGGDVETAASRSQALLDAGAARVDSIAEYATGNPYQFSGQLAGAALAGGVAVKGAGRLAGTSGARATAAAIQPGEELAIRGATRAAGATSRGAAAIDATPGQELRPSDVARLAGRNVRSRAPSIDTTGLRQTLGEARAQTPGVEFTTNPDAPRFAVDPGLGQQTLANIRRALDTSGRDLSLTDITESTRIADAGRRIGELGQRAPSGRDIGETATDATAADAGRHVGELGQRAGDAVRDRTPTADDVTDTAATAGQTVGERVTEGVREIGELGQRAGERVGTRIYEETQPSNVGVREANTAIAARAGLQRLSDLESQIGFLSGNLGRRVGESVGTGIQRATTGDAAAQLDATTSQLAGRYQDATTTVADVSRRGGESVGEALRRATELRNLGIRVRAGRPPRSGTGEAVDLADRSDIDAQDADQPIDTTPEGESDAGDVGDAGDVTTVEVGGGQLALQRVETTTETDASARPAAETTALRRAPFNIGDEADAVAEQSIDTVGDTTETGVGDGVAEGGADGFDAGIDDVGVEEVTATVDHVQEGLSMGVENVNDIGQGAGATPRFDVDTGVETGVGTDTRVESGQRLNLELARGLESEPRVVPPIEAGEEDEQDAYETTVALDTSAFDTGIADVEELEQAFEEMEQTADQQFN